MTVDENDKAIIRLEEKVDTILTRLEDLPKIEERIRKLEVVSFGIPEMKQDIKDLESKSDTWSVLNSLGVAIVGILTAILRTK